MEGIFGAYPALALIALLSAWFLLAYLNAAEAAFLGVNDVRVQHRAEGGDRRAAFLARQLEERERLLSFLLACMKLASCLLALVLFRMLLVLRTDPLRLGLLVAALVVFMILVAVRLPGALGSRWADQLAIPLVWPLRLLERFPLRGPMAFLGGLVRSTGRFLGSPLAGVEPGFRFDELRLLLEASEQRGVLDPVSNRMLQAILGLGEIQVRQAMLPLDDVVSVPESESVQRAARLAAETGFSRLPLFAESRERVTGYVHVRDLLIRVTRSPELPVREIKQEIRFLDPGESLVTALRLFRSSRYHMACVADEQGRALGLLTVEDVLERIVGEIEDEHDTLTDSVHAEGEGVWVVDPHLELEDLRILVGVEVPPGEYRTLGGFLVGQRRSPPVSGARTEVGDWVFTVVEADDLTVKQVRVERRAPVTASPASESDDG